MRFIGIISLLLVAIQATVIGQPIDSLKFFLIDKETARPIEDAFIFYEGSSIGTNSNADGEATLPKSKLSQSNIVITHINYENHSLAPQKTK